MEKSLLLLEQLIKMEEVRDIEWKNLMISLHQAEKTVGESSIAFHLKILRDLIKEEAGLLQKGQSDTVNLGGEDFQVCCGARGR